MSGYARSAWVRAQPPSGNTHAVIAPTVMRILADEGYGPRRSAQADRTTLLDAHAGVGGVSKLAALLGYELHANDLNMACAVALRHAMSGRVITREELQAATARTAESLRTHQFLRMDAEDVLTRPHFDLANRLAHGIGRAAGDPALRDALAVLLWHYVLTLVPGGVLKASQFTAMVRDENWDNIPTSADTALRAVLSDPDALLRRCLERLNGGAHAFAQPIAVTEYDAPACIAAHPTQVVLLDPPSPGDKPYNVQAARVSRLVTGEEYQGREMVPSGRKEEEVLWARQHARQCLEAAKDRECVVWIAKDTAAGVLIGPSIMREMMEAVAPLRRVRFETYESRRTPARIHLAVWC